MTDIWELKALERRVESLERGRDEEREERRLLRDRRSAMYLAVFWTLYVIGLTTMIVLAATGVIHHH
jgi:hypothetical protein